jgi:hypothetical protein
MRYLNEPQLAAHVIERGYRSAESFRAENVCPQWLNAYQALPHSRRTTAC